MTDVSRSQSNKTEPYGTAGTAESKAVSALSEEAIKWAQKRGISKQTLEKLGAASGIEYFTNPDGKAPAIFFPYTQNNEVINYKASRIGSKGFTSKKGGTWCLYGEDDIVGSRANILVITEGEWDRGALIEAGLDPGNVGSVPCGAGSAKADADGTQRGFEYLERALKRGLNKCTKYILATDNDDPGRALRHNLVKVLGAAKTYFVEWPEGIKDANEMLIEKGPKALLKLIDSAKPWPVQGLYRLSDLPEPPKLETWRLGFPEWEDKILTSPGLLSVATGNPGNGKTVLWSQIWYSICSTYGERICVASFETQPKPHIRRQIRTLYSGVLEANMSDRQKKQADEWINEHYLWLSHPDQEPTLEWLLDAAEVAIVRHGARILQIDPWNRLETNRGRHETETDYIGRCLTALMSFAQTMGCHVQVIAHPAKAHNDRKGLPPNLDDIAGSKHWDNRPDQGFVVHRPKMFDGDEVRTETEFYFRKSRYVEDHGHPRKMDLRFDMASRRYVSTQYDM